MVFVDPPRQLRNLSHYGRRARYHWMWAAAEAASVLVATTWKSAANVVEIAARLCSARSCAGLSLQERGYRGRRWEEGAVILQPTHYYRAWVEWKSCPRVVISQAMWTSRNGLGPACNGLVIQACIAWGPTSLGPFGPAFPGEIDGRTPPNLIPHNYGLPL